MSRRWAPLIASAAILAAGMAYVVLWAGGPADCTAVDVRAGSWQPDGVVVDVIDECPMRPGDLVTEVDGRPLTTVPLAETWVVGETLEYTVVRGGRELTFPVTLRQPDVAGRLAPAWSTLLFVVSLLVLSGYVAWRKPGPPTNALLILGSGLAASTLPTLLGLPVVGLFKPAEHWLYLLLTQAVYITAWAACLTFALLFPRPRLGLRNRWTRAALFAAPVWITAGWAAAAAASSDNLLEWTGMLIAGGAVVIIVTQLAIVAISVSQLRRAADALERQQMRWLTGGAVLALSVGLAGWLIPQVLLGEGLPTAWIGLAGLPFVFGLGVALLRFRLFDLDVILNRGLVYGLLTVSVGSRGVSCSNGSGGAAWANHCDSRRARAAPRPAPASPRCRRAGAARPRRAQRCHRRAPRHHSQDGAEPGVQRADQAASSRPRGSEAASARGRARPKAGKSSRPRWNISRLISGNPRSRTTTPAGGAGTQSLQPLAGAPALRRARVCRRLS
jgi:hypothetical protein